MTDYTRIEESDASDKLRKFCEENGILTFRHLIKIGPDDLSKYRGMTAALLKEIDEYAQLLEKIRRNLPSTSLMVGDVIETEDGITKVVQVCLENSGVWTEANPFTESDVVRPVHITTSYFIEKYFVTNTVSDHNIWERTCDNGDIKVTCRFKCDDEVEVSILKKCKTFTSITINYVHELQHLLRLTGIEEKFVFNIDKHCKRLPEHIDPIDDDDEEL